MELQGCLKKLQETKGRVVDKEVGAVHFSSSSFASFEQATECAESKRVSGPKTVPGTQIATNSGTSTAEVYS